MNEEQPGSRRSLTDVRVILMILSKLIQAEKNNNRELSETVEEHNDVDANSSNANSSEQDVN